MIDRYSTKEMRYLWSLENKFSIWQDIEIAACEYWRNAGRINESDFNDIKNKAAFSVERVLEIENEVHHDVIAFLTNLAENIGGASRFVHFGLTSSDVVDTGFTVIIQKTGELILGAYDKYLEALKKKAIEHKDLPAVGRTHGVHAEPTTLGLKLLGYYEEAKRNYDRLKTALDEASFGKLSGAVGTYSQLPIELETFVMQKLGIKSEPVSTQVVPRDRHAHLLNAISMCAQGIARLAQEIRLLQKTESREVEEPFQKGQKGSSAMPHKRNPILCERMCGLARVLLGYAVTGQQNISLWHERDISHSSAERVVFPDAMSLLEYMLIKMTFVVENLHVYPETAERVLSLTKGLLYSSRALLVITETLGISREEAYSIVQSEAMKVWAAHDGPGLKERLSARDDLKKIEPSAWEGVFDPVSFLKNVDSIYKRCGLL
ncbi:MAG: adenylosuccinate lyase [Spirochaetia bacterium]|nr:adenylosuccinate lyase [Spirochaetia bacterium]